VVVPVRAERRRAEERVGAGPVAVPGTGLPVRVFCV